MKRPFHLVPGHVSRDTIESFARWLRRSEDGDVMGCALAIMLKNRTVVIDVTGEARRSPIFARGMVAELDDALAALSKIGSGR